MYESAVYELRNTKTIITQRYDLVQFVLIFHITDVVDISFEKDEQWNWFCFEISILSFSHWDSYEKICLGFRIECFGLHLFILCYVLIIIHSFKEVESLGNGFYQIFRLTCAYAFRRKTAVLAFSYRRRATPFGLLQSQIALV
jgi:hypothetical protein